MQKNKIFLLSYLCWRVRRGAHVVRPRNPSRFRAAGRAGSTPNSSRCGAGRIGERQWFGRRFGNG